MAMSRAKVDLPQPDSPTTASVLPGARVKLAPATARSVTACLNGPLPTW